MIYDHYSSSHNPCSNISNTKPEIRDSVV